MKDGMWWADQSQRLIHKVARRGTVVPDIMADAQGIVLDGLTGSLAS